MIQDYEGKTQGNTKIRSKAQATTGCRGETGDKETVKMPACLKYMEFKRREILFKCVLARGNVDPHETPWLAFVFTVSVAL